MRRSDPRHSVQLFDGFPYVSTRVAGALRHIILLPVRAPEAELAGVARRQALANQLPTCLVLASDRAIYFGPDGHGFASQEPPLGGLIVTGSLVPAVNCDDASDELRARQHTLADLVECSRGSGFVVGDLTKGGHPASDDEYRRLQGYLPDGTPRGLSRCETCGDWKGECLDPSEQFTGQVMTVHCCCENRNRCARCNTRLFERRLNANYYDPADRSIWHVPGFCGLDHQCSADNEHRVPNIGRRVVTQR
jgi:hypothetical protein